MSLSIPNLFIYSFYGIYGRVHIILLIKSLDKSIYKLCIFRMKMEKLAMKRVLGNRVTKFSPI